MDGRSQKKHLKRYQITPPKDRVTLPLGLVLKGAELTWKNGVLLITSIVGEYTEHSLVSGLGPDGWPTNNLTKETYFAHSIWANAKERYPARLKMLSSDSTVYYAHCGEQNPDVIS
jgi:hypothetical protein